MEGAEIDLPGFVPNSLSQSTIHAIYCLSSLPILSLVWFLSLPSPKLSTTDRLLMCWFIFTDLTHIILEGYFIFSPQFYKDKTAGFYLAQVWKENSKGNSRYALSNSNVVSIEIITVSLTGTACLLALYAIATRKPYSYILQLGISVCHLCGLGVYYLTSYLEGDKFVASLYYYYVCYIIANTTWVVIPFVIVVRCWRKICGAC